MADNHRNVNRLVEENKERESFVGFFEKTYWR